jgi:hypothetical protein
MRYVAHRFKVKQRLKRTIKMSNIIPLQIFNQCLFTDFPINTTLLINAYSFNHQVHYDMFRPVILALFTDDRSYLPKHVLLNVTTKLIYNNLWTCIHRIINRLTWIEFSNSTHI